MSLLKSNNFIKQNNLNQVLTSKYLEIKRRGDSTTENKPKIIIKTLRNVKVKYYTTSEKDTMKYIFIK